jgi:Transcriptional regulator
MELRVLEYFLVVARTENISKAAEIIHITQPTLSRQIKALEEELGISLLTRGTKNVKLTSEGILFRSRAEEIVALVNKTKSELSFQTEDLVGEIRIGSGETDAFSYLASCMKKFSEQYPRVSFHVFSGNAADIELKINQGSIDIGFLSTPVDVSRYDYLDFGLEEKWGILVKKDHYFSNKEEIHIQELHHFNLIVPERLMNNGTIKEWFGTDFEKEIKMTYTLIINAMTMMENDIGIVLCIDKENYDQLGYKFIPLSPIKKANPVLVWKKNHMFSKATKVFIQKLHNKI